MENRSSTVWPMGGRVLSVSRPRVAAVLAATFIVAALGWLYADVVPGLVRQWAADADYSHGFFVAPLAAFFVWERRARLADLPLRPHLAGVALLALSLCVFIAGRYGSELFLTRVSMIGVVAGLVLFLAGWAHLKALAFPIAFLLLMIPLPAIVFNQVAFPLQMLASQLGEVVISASGVPVLREGNVLLLPGRALEVAEACSGIRSLMSLFMLAVVLGYFTEHRAGPRIAIAIAAVPIAVIANATRVAGTGLASYWISPAAAEGFFHSFSGWLMFVVALAGLLLVHRMFELARGRALRVARSLDSAQGRPFDSAQGRPFDSAQGRRGW
jgi:exosortase